MLVVIIGLALWLDWLIGEPSRYHPLVGFGRYADWLEQRFNPVKVEDSADKVNPSTLADDGDLSEQAQGIRIQGVFALSLALWPFLIVAQLVDSLLIAMPVVYGLVAAVIVYFCVGWRSLLSHAMAVFVPLNADDLPAARDAVGRIVSRNTETLNAQEIASATTESVLENGSDAIFAPLFWFVIGGIPGVVLYRLSNTLDAMWGYKNTRFLYFGWAAARLDDVLNWLPARLTALAYAFSGSTAKALNCWREQAPTWKSPNAGPVMASGAGALNVELGGAARYHGKVHQRPVLGCGDAPEAATINRACDLVNRALSLWLVGLLGWFVGALVL